MWAATSKGTGVGLPKSFRDHVQQPFAQEAVRFNVCPAQSHFCFDPILPFSVPIPIWNMFVLYYCSLEVYDLFSDLLQGLTAGVCLESHNRLWT